MITDSHPLPNEAELQRFEISVGCRMPEDYRQFLLLHNGGRTRSSSFPLLWKEESLAKRFPKGLFHILFCLNASGTNDLHCNLAQYRERIPANTFPIGMDPGGNILLLGLSAPYTGCVLFWVQDQEVDWEGGETPNFSNIGIAAQSFDMFLESLG